MQVIFLIPGFSCFKAPRSALKIAITTKGALLKYGGVWKANSALADCDCVQGAWRRGSGPVERDGNGVQQ